MNRVQNRSVLSELLKTEINQWNRADLLTVFYKNGVPAGSVNNMKEVFEMPKAQEMILEEKMPDGSRSQRVKTVAFQFRNA